MNNLRALSTRMSWKNKVVRWHHNLVKLSWFYINMTQTNSSVKCQKKIIFVFFFFSSLNKIHITNGGLRVHSIIHSTLFTTSYPLTFIMFPLSLGVLDRMVGVYVEASFFFEIHQVEPILSFQVILTVLTIVVQIQEVVQQEKVVCRILSSKFNRR